MGTNFVCAGFPPNGHKKAVVSHGFFEARLYG